MLLKLNLDSIYKCPYLFQFSLNKSLKFICNLCVEKVKETSVFRYQILVSQSKLKECYSSTISNIDVKRLYIYIFKPTNGSVHIRD